MLHLLFPNPSTQKNLTANSLGPFIQSYANSLYADGFKQSTMKQLVRIASHFGYWIDIKGISVQSIDSQILQLFLDHLLTCNCPRSRAGEHIHTVNGIPRFLKYLVDSKVITILPIEINPLSPREILLDKFTKWTQLTRGVSQQTAKTQRSHAISILDSLGSEPELWEVRDIRRFVLAHKNQYQASYTKAIGSNLRAFLRFLVVEGLCKPELIDAVPQIAYWRLSDIPRHLQPESVERVIAASGSRPHSELRDRAVILLLSRLGLRARDVVNLCLSDIDWQKGLLRIVGKGRRETWLPLPQEPGNALLAYLEHERPLSMHKHVFLRCRAPFSPLKGIGTIQIIVRCALKKANVEAPPRVTTHLFRHSFAKRLLAQNIPLEGIGVILRHRNLQTTAQYAKIDMNLLQTVVQPWPEVKESTHVNSKRK